MRPFTSFQLVLVCLALYAVASDAFAQNEVMNSLHAYGVFFWSEKTIYFLWVSSDCGSRIWIVHVLTTFKEAIYEDPFLVMSNWNPIDEDPCDWSGISCSSARDHVVKVNISWASLKGFLAPELSMLSSLQELILHGNRLIGIIPKEIGMLKNLKLLDLGVNQLSGLIPPEIGNLTSIMKINLQFNGLTGKLSTELADLKSLQVLRLDRNKLQGVVSAGNG